MQFLMEGYAWRRESGFPCNVAEGFRSSVDGMKCLIIGICSSLSGEEQQIRVFFLTLVVSSKQFV